uniref:Uncharacterized protein n=1 Tax=Anopheles albimanus TaxID=7167 RepID=A0A182FXL0_ANOAL
MWRKCHPPVDMMDVFRYTDGDESIETTATADSDEEYDATSNSVENAAPAVAVTG